jgi:hypothetical protein
VSDLDAIAGELDALVQQELQLQLRAERQYKPRVEALVRTGSRDAQQIEHTLDGLLDFCGHGPVLALYRRLCRHYWDIDPAATAFYVKAYRELWHSEEIDEQGRLQGTLPLVGQA